MACTRAAHWINSEGNTCYPIHDPSDANTMSPRCQMCAFRGTPIQQQAVQEQHQQQQQQQLQQKREALQKQKPSSQVRDLATQDISKECGDTEMEPKTSLSSDQNEPYLDLIGAYDNKPRSGFPQHMRPESGDRALGKESPPQSTPSSSMTGPSNAPKKNNPSRKKDMLANALKDVPLSWEIQRLDSMLSRAALEGSMTRY
ncbi:hypothetical protein PoB_003578600 [Plakobranchus ocellatus]|uniref:Uncharacterized protein n=1 Tax=Plakobranchus ocellatus TaxID=259542 RepID=A0AAV4ADM0_9GAST|nr:hypothetical protein PoB_003578600 [Plakobranchus ocellatus]